MKKLRIGTRGSKLALVQAEQVRATLSESRPDLDIELTVIKTTGDKVLDAPLSKIGDKGLFTKEIEKELLDGTIDLAVHSMKDMPTMLPDGLIIGAVTKRLDPCDVFISKNGKRLSDLRPGDSIATSSLRRRAQLLAYNPGLHIHDIRGNVQSRLKKMRENPELNGIILAHAGIIRLNMEDIITEVIPGDVIVPAVGQASLAIEVREDSALTREIVSLLDDHDSHVAVTCERVFLSELGGGCQVPIAGLAVVRDNMITLNGVVAGLDGKKVYRNSITGPVSDLKFIGKSLARQLLDSGAKEILEVIYGRSLERRNHEI